LKELENLEIHNGYKTKMAENENVNKESAKDDRTEET